MDFSYKEFKNFKAISFEVGENKYIYDTFSNRFIKVDQIVLDILDDTFELSRDEIINKHKGKYDPENIANTLENIDNAKKNKNLFIDFSIPKLSISSKKSTLDKVKEKVTSLLNKIVFNLTEDCNFRCEYCVYSGSYKFRRNHNKSNDLSWDIGRKAIDFFINNSNLSNERYITFYGGEPLLNFDFIKKAVEYNDELNSNIKLTITTNGSLLNKDRIKYIVDHNVRLQISLDGPQRIHDRFRKLENNKPTYNLVEDKLKFLKKNFPDYYSSHVSISAVLAPHEENIETLDKFFANNKLFSELKSDKKISIGVINPAANTFVKKYNYSMFYYKYLFGMFNVYKDYHVNSNDLSEIPISKDLLARFIKILHFRSVKPISDYPYYWPNGICIPGMRTLFISSDGSFYPCEKIYDYGRMYVGNIFDGFDFQRITNYIDEYCKISIHDCKDCWLYRLCGECFLNLCNYKTDTFNLNKRRPFCDAQKYLMAAHMKLYVSIREKNDNAFDYLPVEEDWDPGYVDQMVDE